MTVFKFANFFATELLEACSAGATQLFIAPSAAALLPSVLDAEDKEIRLVLWDGVRPHEIVAVTENLQSGVLTVVRGKEGTTAKQWQSGTQIRSAITAEVMDAALAAYFDYLVVLNANFLKLTGGTLTGALTLAADPLVALGAATKQYVDSVQGNKLPLAGGTMLGSINMNGNRILSLPTPLAAAEPATKSYVDAIQTIVGKLFSDMSGALGTAGTSSAYNVTSNSVFTSLADGIAITVRFHTTNDLGPTLQLDGLVAKQIRANIGQSLPVGFLLAGMPTRVVYNAAADSWLIQSINQPTFDFTAGDIKHSMQTADHGRWLLADGRAVSRTGDTLALFQVCGTAHGVGNGVTTFNILDGRGRVLVGRDDMGGVAANRITNAEVGFVGTLLGATGGVQSLALSIAQLAVHGHTVIDPGHTHAFSTGSPALTGAVATGQGAPGSNYGVGSIVANTTGISLGNTGSGSTHSNVQPSTIVNVFQRK